MNHDDYIHACHRMEDEAEQLATGGGFAGNLALAYRHIARAYYAADGVNQKQMRRDFAPLFEHMHQRYRSGLAAPSAGVQSQRPVYDGDGEPSALHPLRWSEPEDPPRPEPDHLEND